MHADARWSQQAVLGGVSLNAKEWKSLGSQPNLEAMQLFRHASRVSQGEPSFDIARCHLMADIRVQPLLTLVSLSNSVLTSSLGWICKSRIQDRSSKLQNFGRLSVRSFNAKAWGDRPVALRQLPHIGEKS